MTWKIPGIPAYNWLVFRQIILTVLHTMQTRSSDENSVCLSVSLSVRLSNA